MTRYAEILRALTSGGVDFILVGGLAAAAHGSVRFTEDVDVVYGRKPQNLAKLAAALAPIHPYLRGAPPGLPFRLDAETLKAGLNFTLTTDLGWLDLLGEMAGAGTYEDIIQQAIEVDVLGVHCRVVAIETLIHAKKAAGRPKDFEAIAELEALRERYRAL